MGGSSAGTGIGGAAGARFHAVGVREAISTVYTARRRVVCKNTLFRRRRLRIPGPRAILVGERPRNRLPIPGSHRGARPHGKSSHSVSKSDLFSRNRSAFEYITILGADPGTRTFVAYMRGLPIGISPPARGSPEIARRRENAIPRRSGTRPVARPLRSIPYDEGTPAMIPAMPASLAQASP